MLITNNSEARSGGVSLNPSSFPSPGSHRAIDSTSEVSLSSFYSLLLGQGFFT